MKKILISLVLIIFLVIIGISISKRTSKNAFQKQTANEPEKKPIIENRIQEKISPIDTPEKRATKKRFGDFITPNNSPVQPERFSGYHTGVDFEVFEEELETDVPVKAVCSGKILEKRVASGYGGLLIQECNIDNQAVTVVYGHLNLKSIEKDIGNILKESEMIGLLGKGKSPETDSERKHLHLGIHKGSKINILGYVQNKELLNDWIDPCLYFCQ